MHAFRCAKVDRIAAGIEIVNEVIKPSLIIRFEVIELNSSNMILTGDFFFLTISEERMNDID